MLNMLKLVKDVKTCYAVLNWNKKYLNMLNVFKVGKKYCNVLGTLYKELTNFCG